MARTRHESQQQRQARFEQFEQRLVMSAQAVASLLPELEIAAPALTQQVITHPLLNNTDDVSQASQAASLADQHGFDGKGQTVAVIDSGIAWDHYALGGGFGAGHKVVGGWDFAENDADPYDDGPAGFHGSHVSGIIGSTDEQYRGVSSGVDLVGLRVFDDQGVGNLQWVEQALQWVHDHRNDFANPITTVNLSLGTTWNGFTTPEWATLEDEFAQLETDGLFISVAAGNAFKSYNTAGLSYPAVSDYVVPVSSHDAQGNMSDFSQRAENVLVAPGESIKSTVPGHLFGKSTSDRFLGSTGTSMAAPYVAGASAVLRQANEFMGINDINQDLLYRQFRETADKIYDSVTQGYYYKVNLEAAIAAVVSGSYNGSNGEQNNESTGKGEHNSTTDPNTDNGHSTNNGDSGDSQNSTTTVTDWGMVVSKSMGSQTIDGQATFQLTASRDGFLTVQTSANQNQALILELYDSQMNRLGSQTGVSSQLRLDTYAKQGETYYLKAIGSATNVQFQLENLVSLNAGKLTIHGTNGVDSISVDASNGFSVTANKINYHFNSSDVQSVQIYGHNGQDSINLQLGSENDTVATHATGVHVRNSQYQLDAYDISQVQVAAGTGYDTVGLAGTAGNDHFSSSADTATLSGQGYTSSVQGFDVIHAKASSGYDSASLTGSDQNELYVSRDSRSAMYGSGWVVVADEYNSTVVEGLGGSDTVQLIGTTGNDQFILRPSDVTMTNAVESVRATGFETSHAFGERGNDTVSIYDSAGNDIFYWNSGIATMIGGAATNTAHGFKNVSVVASTGSDRAFLFDSASNDTFNSSSDIAVLKSSDYQIHTTGFDRVDAYAINGGYDRAIIVGSDQADSLEATTRNVTLTDSDGRIRRTTGFEKSEVDLRGGINQAIFEGSEAAERFQAGYANIEFETTRQLLQVKDAVNSTFNGRGGLDEVIIEEFQALDLLSSLGGKATAYLKNHSVSAEDFAVLEARSVDDAIADYDLDSADFTYLLKGKWKPR